MHRTQLTTIPSRHRPWVRACLRRGFTLIELLVATLLAALLMAAVLGVLKGVTRSQKTLMRRDPDALWKTRLISQLECDLANSRSVVPTEDGFQLTGFAGRDFASGAALHGPTTIQYAVRNLAGQFWLVRSEVHLDSLNLDNDSLELVCNKVERIVFDSSDKQPPKAQAKGAEDSPLPISPSSSCMLPDSRSRSLNTHSSYANNASELKERSSRDAFVLVMVLVLLVVAALSLAGVARRSLESAEEAATAQEDLQRRWGVLSVLRLYLPSAESLMEAEAKKQAAQGQGWPFPASVSGEFV